MFQFYMLVSVICSPLLTECLNIDHQTQFKNLQDCKQAAQRINLKITRPGTTIKNYCKEKKLWQV